MMTTTTPGGQTSVRVRYTLRLIAGFTFVTATVALTYWLLFQYEVRNFLGLALIVVFLAIPSVIAVFKLPGEMLALIAVWRSDDPASLEQALGDLRERDLL